MDDLLFNRQPVYNRNQKLIGYRVVCAPAAPREEGNDGGAIRALQSLDAGDLRIWTGDQALFLRAPQAFLSEPDWRPPIEKSVIEFPAILFRGRRDLQERLKELRSPVTQIALDHPEALEKGSELLEIGDLLAFDVGCRERSEIEAAIDGLRPFRGHLLANGVDTQQSYQDCLGMGFDFFQGFFYCEPAPRGGRSHSPANALIMKLLAEIQNPDSGLKEIEEVISSDSVISYRLLRYLNSAHLGLKHKVDSLARAVTYLGLEPLRVWVSVLLLARIGDKPAELLKTCLVRARMCRGLAEQSKTADPGSCFLTGLLSLLPALTDRPMAELVAELPLAEGVCAALLHGAGELGKILETVVHYERGRWARLAAAGPREVLRRAYLEAVRFTEQSVAKL